MSVRVPLHGAEGIVAYALVDESDAEIVSGYRWNLLCAGYAISRDGRSGPPVYMHRLLLGLGLGDPRQADHINRDKLDNRRANLRITTNAQNGQNKPSYAGSSSVYRGVSLITRSGKWAASVWLAGRHHRLGHFDNELDAARAAARFRAEHMPFSVEDPALLEDVAA